jgi:hypothetical protein
MWKSERERDREGEREKKMEIGRDNGTLKWESMTEQISN